MNIVRNTWDVLEAGEKNRFAILTVLDILVSIADIVSLALLLGIVQFYIQPSAHSAWLSLLPGWLFSQSSISGIAVFFILFSVKNLLAIVVTRWQFNFTGRVAVRLSELQLSRYQAASFNEFISVDSSAHIRAIAFQPFEFSQYLLTGMQQLISQSFLVALTLTAIILFKARIFVLLLLVLLPPVAAVFFFIKRKLDRTRSGIRSDNEHSFRYLLDALKGYVEGNVYGRNHFFKKRFIESRRRFSKHLFDSLGIQAMPGRIVELFAVLGLFLLIIQAHRTGNDRDALLNIGAFLAAAYKVIPGIIKLINISGQMKTYGLSVSEAAHRNKDIVTTTGGETRAPLRSIEFRDVSFGYGNDRLLSQINFSIRSGDFAGISGHSGRGKTTLLNLLLGFLETSQGEVLINGNRTGLREWWPSIAYVRQQAFLINDTIVKNITLKEDDPDEERLQEALRLSGLDDILPRFPEGRQHVLTENGKNISGGQQQRIALARALYHQATLFLLDEPFNELDEASEILLLRHFQELARSGKIVLMITHDQRSLSYCNKIVLLDA